MSFLERMRAKPRHVKTQYAFVGAFVSTAIVATLWTLSLPAKFDKTLAEQEVEKESSTNSLEETFEAAKTQIGTVIESIKEVKEVDEPATSTPDLEPAPQLEISEDSVELTKEPRVILIATTTSENTQ